MVVIKKIPPVKEVSSEMYQFKISSSGKAFTIFCVSRLTVMPLKNSSNGYLAFPIVSHAKSFASLVIPDFL